MGGSRAVQKDRQIELIDLGIKRVHGRRVDEHLAVDMGIEQNGAKALFWPCARFRSPIASMFFERQRGDAGQAVFVRRNPLCQDIVGLVHYFQRLLGPLN